MINTTIVLASGNTHKTREISSLLPPEVSLQPQSDFGVESPEETGTTFIENALIKAHYAARQTGMPAIADDSGVCVSALGGAPGIRSARYAGETATDQQNVEKLLAEMEHAKDRAAFFYCVLVYLKSADDPTPIITEGRWQGSIAQRSSGTNGFGYDPVFWVPSHNTTAANLDQLEKNRISHRGQALQQLTARLTS